jgi:DNA-binding response OmpR family regulator
MDEMEESYSEQILIVEDEPGIAGMISSILQANGYTVLKAGTGRDGLMQAASKAPDLILLDLGLPDMDGQKLIRSVREWSEMPIIVVSARAHERDKVAALDSGADDYLTKPFAMAELLARVRAISRRQPELTGTDLKFRDLKLDRADYSLSGPDGAVRLASKEFQIMEMLMANSGQVISTERFMERVWGYESEAEINVVWVNISGLRKKIAALGAHVQIKAARGVGYILEATDGK